MSRSPLEFKLTRYPTQLGISSDYDSSKLPKREGGQYSIRLDAALPDDRQMFFGLWEKDGLDWTTANGRLSEIAAFHPAWQDKSAKSVLEQLANAVQALPPLVAAAAKAEAEVAAHKESLSQNTDQAKAESLFVELRRAKDAAELATIKAETLSRRIAALRAQLQELIVKYRREQFRAVKGSADEAIGAFNAELRAAYRKLWQVLGPALPRLAEFAPQNQVFPPRIHFLSPLMSVPDSDALKSFRKIPQIEVQKDCYRFGLAEYLDGSKPKRR